MAACKGALCWQGAPRKLAHLMHCVAARLTLFILPASSLVSVCPRMRPPTSTPHASSWAWTVIVLELTSEAEPHLKRSCCVASWSSEALTRRPTQSPLILNRSLAAAASPPPADSPDTCGLPQASQCSGYSIYGVLTIKQDLCSSDLASALQQLAHKQSSNNCPRNLQTFCMTCGLRPVTCII